VVINISRETNLGRCYMLTQTKLGCFLNPINGAIILSRGTDLSWCYMLAHTNRRVSSKPYRRGNRLKLGDQLKSVLHAHAIQIQGCFLNPINGAINSNWKSTKVGVTCSRIHAKGDFLPHQWGSWHGSHVDLRWQHVLLLQQ
jgi:hypothetical protein